MEERIVESTITHKDQGLELLPWLCSRFLYCDETAWRGYVEGSFVTVNGQAASPETALRLGDIVGFKPPPVEEPEVSIDYRVAYEDEHFAVIDKPALLPVHPGGRFFKHTLWYLLRDRYEYLHFATRLDRETSGLMLVCLNRGAVKHASKLQAAGGIHKEYRVLVHGQFPAALNAKGFLTPDERSLIRKKRRFLAEGEVGALEASLGRGPGIQTAETEFRLLAAQDTRGGLVSLLSARLITGRTHQIRATLSSLGFPLCGDKLYGLDESLFLRFIDGSLSASDRELLMLPNQALHSHWLAFDSVAGEKIECRSAFSQELWLGFRP